MPSIDGNTGHGNATAAEEAQQMFSGMSVDEQAAFSRYHGRMSFNTLHSSQYTSMSLPSHLKATVHHKLYNEVYDIDTAFAIEYVEDESESDSDATATTTAHYQLVSIDSIQPSTPASVSAAVTAGGPPDATVWLIEHSWTTTAEHAIQQLVTIDGLLVRMARIANVLPPASEGDNSATASAQAYNAMTVEQQAVHVWKALFAQRLVGRYATTVAAADAATTAATLKVDNITFNYFVCDEYGSAAISGSTARLAQQNSGNSTGVIASSSSNAHMNHLVVITQGGVAFSLLWLACAVEAEDIITVTLPSQLPFPDASVPVGAATAAAATSSSTAPQMMAKPEPTTAQLAAAAAYKPSQQEIDAVMQCTGVDAAAATAQLHESMNTTDAVMEISSRQ